MPPSRTVSSGRSSFTQQWRSLLIVFLAANVLRIAYFDFGPAASCQGEASNHAKAVIDGMTDKTEDLNEMERVYAEGSRRFRQYLWERQERCSGATVVALQASTTSVSLLYQVRQVATSLLMLTANTDDAVLSWGDTVLPDKYRTASCSTFECYFLPISTCTVAGVSSSDDSQLRECPSNDSIMDILARKAGLDELDRPELFDWVFFLSEATRYVTRPNAALIEMVRDLRSTVYAPVLDWRPYRFAASRIAVHLKGSYGHEPMVQRRYWQGPRIYAYSQSGTGVDQVLLRGDDRDAMKEFEKNFNALKTLADVDANQRRRGQEDTMSKIPVLVLDSKNAVINEGLRLFAEATVFAECDLFVADMKRSFAVHVALLMRSLRHSHVIPVWDARGLPFSLSLKLEDED